MGGEKERIQNSEFRRQKERREEKRRKTSNIQSRLVGKRRIKEMLNAEKEELVSMPRVAQERLSEIQKGGTQQGSRAKKMDTCLRRYDIEDMWVKASAYRIMRNAVNGGHGPPYRRIPRFYIGG